MDPGTVSPLVPLNPGLVFPFVKVYKHCRYFHAPIEISYVSRSISLPKIYGVDGYYSNKFSR